METWQPRGARRGNRVCTWARQPSSAQARHFPCFARVAKLGSGTRAAKRGRRVQDNAGRACPVVTRCGEERATLRGGTRDGCVPAHKMQRVVT